MLKLINILPRKSRVYLKLDMAKKHTVMRRKFCACRAEFFAIFHEQLFLYALTSAFRIQADTYGTFQKFIDCVFGFYFIEGRLV